MARTAAADDASSASRLTDLFCLLAAIPSPTRAERACGDAVEAELAALGLTVSGDGAGARVGGDCDNLYCRIPATAPGRPLLLCAHLDTVPASDALCPVVVDGVLRNATPSIVGADNKAAVTVLLDVARTVCVERRPHAGIELLFTIGEEQGLLGSRALDPSMLTARTGYVLDHPGAVGGYVAAAPSRFVVRATMRGRAAHSGIAPEGGVNAIVPLARAIAALPPAGPDVSVNVASVQGGTALNVVPDRAEAGIDVRSLDHDAAVRVVERIDATLRRHAGEAGCALEVDVDNPYVAYRLPPDSQALALATAACGRLGLPVEPLETRGGSDANALRAAGFDCVNLTHAVVDFHGPEERVAVADLVLMEEVVLEIVAGCCERH
jgi:tripeptide aminopeptidase